MICDLSLDAERPQCRCPKAAAALFTLGLEPGKLEPVRLYTLRADGTPAECMSPKVWSEWMEANRAACLIAIETRGDIAVGTQFTGIVTHRTPGLYETTVLGGSFERRCFPSANLAAARELHTAVCALVWPVAKGAQG